MRLLTIVPVMLLSACVTPKTEIQSAAEPESHDETVVWNLVSMQGMPSDADYGTSLDLKSIRLQTDSVNYSDWDVLKTGCNGVLRHKRLVILTHTRTVKTENGLKTIPATYRRVAEIIRHQVGCYEQTPNGDRRARAMIAEDLFAQNAVQKDTTISAEIMNGELVVNDKSGRPFAYFSPATKPR